MPTLDFKGKQIVYAHHLTVPSRTLEPDAEKSLPAKDQKPSLDDNLIIHGDNLHALKALLPRYAGRVNCIYIDPPYNTGNENWAYNDNVNSPLMQEWLKDKSPVDGEDLERHDKWLCMMWPRLHLLRELLAENGAIFVSIDDNEQHHLRMMMDEIFGEENFVANIVWQKRTSPDFRLVLGDGHENVLVYAKSAVLFREKANLLSLSARQLKEYKNPDNDPRGPWVSRDFSAQGHRPNQMYKIVTPAGAEYYPPEGRCWKNVESVFLSQRKEGRFWFGEDGKGVPRRKNYLSEATGRQSWSWWPNDEAGHTQEAKREVMAFFGESEIFDTPKPVRLIRRMLQIATNPGGLVLDSFAGSGTTAQAVLALNAKDGGNRKFILVECEDYADTITAERVRRVINGVPTAKDENLKNGLGGSFTYCTLGDEISSEKMLTGENLPDYETLARHLVYTATGHAPDTIRKAKGKDGLFHETDDRLFYLIYEPDLAFLRSAESALNGDRAERIAKQAKSKQKTAVVFATHKFMGQKELTQMGIVFCGLPYGIYGME